MANDTKPTMDDLKKRKVSPRNPQAETSVPVAGNSGSDDEMKKISPKTAKKEEQQVVEKQKVSPKEKIEANLTTPVVEVASEASDTSAAAAPSSTGSKKISPKINAKTSESKPASDVRAVAMAKAKEARAKVKGTSVTKKSVDEVKPNDPAPESKKVGKRPSLLGLGVIRSNGNVVSQVLPSDIPTESSVNRVRDPLTGEEVDVVVDESDNAGDFPWLEAALISSGVVALIALVIILRSHTNLLVPVSSWARVKASHSDNPVFQTLLTVLAHMTGDVSGSVPSDACLLPVKTVESSGFGVSKFMRAGRIAKAIKAGGVLRTPEQYIYRVTKVKTYRHFVVIETKEKENFLIISYNQNANTLFMLNSKGEGFSINRELLIAPGVDLVG